jgi:MFS family permease
MDYILTSGSFFWVPMGNYYGKRPIFVIACLGLSMCYLWGAVANSFESLLWSNIIAAFFGSSTEAVGVSTVNDLFVNLENKPRRLC